ncbi:UNVERIFIED_CONTAM: hypothetical protein K2H54_062379 [Gekko kuhli]
MQEIQQRHGLANSISSYLIKPVQRITKYQLLLKGLVARHGLGGVRLSAVAAEPELFLLLPQEEQQVQALFQQEEEEAVAPSTALAWWRKARRLLQMALELLTCCEEGKGEIKDGLEVMLSVPKRANDAMHLSMLEGRAQPLVTPLAYRLPPWGWVETLL